MSQNQNRGKNIDLTIYDSMATQDLEEILRLDAEMPEGQESDLDKILYIMEVLAERKRNSSHTGRTALEAFESFKQNYMPETDHTVLPFKKSQKSPRRLRGLAAVAAVLAILITGVITAKAFGLDVLKVVVHWSEDAFYFGNERSAQIDAGPSYVSLQDALIRGNAPAWLEPTYFPDGFVLTEIDVQLTPRKKIYTARYQYSEKIMIVSVRNYLDGAPVFAEQSNGSAEVYEISGITYYLFSNQDQNSAVWLYGTYECEISGDVTIQELKEMIASIQKG